MKLNGPITPFAPAIVEPVLIDSWVAASVASHARVASNAVPRPVTVTVGPVTDSPSAGLAITFGPGVAEVLGNSEVLGDGATGVVAVDGALGEVLGAGDDAPVLARVPLQPARSARPRSAASAGTRCWRRDARAVRRITFASESGGLALSSQLRAAPSGKHRTTLCHMPEPGTVRDCIFCRIIAGEIPATIVASNDSAIAFRDLAPQAPLHVLVVPRVHVPDVATLAIEAPGVLADVVALAKSVAVAEADGQFRLIFNTGARSGQSVFHVHGHVIGGAELGWAPA